MIGNVIPQIDWLPGFVGNYDAYSGNDRAGNLRHHSLHECVNELLLECEDLGEIVEIFAFKRETVDPGFIMSHLETLCESLDEEYGDPDGNPFDVLEHEPIATAAHNLARAIVEHYPVWTCEVAATIRVPLRAWAADNGVG